MSNPVVFMDITIGGAAAGRMTFEVSTSALRMSTSSSALRDVRRSITTRALLRAALRGRRAEDGRELPRSVHGREGHGPHGQAVRLRSARFICLRLR